MNDDFGLRNIRITLDSANRETVRGRADMAIQLLQGIKDDVDALSGTSEWVEFPLQIGEALSAQHDPDAETFFEEASDRATSTGVAPELLIRLHENFGLFYASVARRPSRARQEFERAKEAAVQAHLSEEIARIDLKVIRLDLDTDKDPEIDNFATLKRVARRGGFTWAEQLRAWYQHLGRPPELGRNLRFARGVKKKKVEKKADDYFLGLLSSVRNSIPLICG